MRLERFLLNQTVRGCAVLRGRAPMQCRSPSDGQVIQKLIERVCGEFARLKAGKWTPAVTWSAMVATAGKTKN